jgi:crotonobetainyl-CoA:carnitine CoA-transferase CaiB-like acyl-CoA transferase
VETRKWTSRDLLEAMLAVDLWCGEIKQHPKVIEDPQVNHSGVITTYEHAKAGPVKVVGPVVRLSATSASIDGPAPMVGQPPQEILREYGVDEGAIESLEMLRIVEQAKIN